MARSAKIFWLVALTLAVLIGAVDAASKSSGPNCHSDYAKSFAKSDHTETEGQYCREWNKQLPAPVP